MWGFGYSQFETCSLPNICPHEEENRIKLLMVGRRWELFKLALLLKKGISKLKETCICSYEKGSYCCYKHSGFFLTIGLKFCILK